MKKHLFLIVLLLYASGLFSQSPREVLNFDRDWLFSRYGLQADGSRIPEPDPLPLSASFDDSRWRKLDIPHDWGIEGPFRIDLEGFTGKLPWKGIGWYRKHFTVSPSDRGKRFYLDFDGAMANAEIWLNGEKVGERPYGYSSFRVDLTSRISFDRENVLAVRLDTEKWGSRWYPGAGIYRHVRLVKTHPVHVAQWGVFVTTPDVTEREATAAVQVELLNNSPEETPVFYSVAIYEQKRNGMPGKRVAASEKKRMVLKPGTSDTGRVVLKVASPDLWSLENTALYTARVFVYREEELIDEYDTPFGFRTIRFTHDNGFLLNGRRVQINGTCLHHDLGALGTAINTSALQTVRLQRHSHFAQSPGPGTFDLSGRNGVPDYGRDFRLLGNRKEER